MIDQHSRDEPKRQSRRATARNIFPDGFLWGCATSAHQIEGDNVNSDMWLIEKTKPTIFREPSGRACNSYQDWPLDLDLVKKLGFSTYRFSLEWSRIEPEPGVFSREGLEHYRAVIQGCKDRNITPIVTFCHFSVPCWFAAEGGWTNTNSPAWFARYCERASNHLAEGIGYAVTINEANIQNILYSLLPPGAADLIKAMNTAAGETCGSDNFKCGLLPEEDQIETMQRHLKLAHVAGRKAIKSARSDLPVGVSLSVTEHQAIGPDSLRDEKVAQFYGDWFELAKSDDFLGVQNYTRLIWNKDGKVAPPEGASFSQLGTEIYAPSLAGAVRHSFEATGVPILITEHGLSTDDDSQREQFTRESLACLHGVLSEENIPVIGYCHWSLLDNFEWIFGYSQQYGLCTVDRETYERVPKDSAYALGKIARDNGVRGDHHA